MKQQSQTEIQDQKDLVDKLTKKYNSLRTKTAKKKCSIELHKQDWILDSMLNSHMNHTKQTTFI